jgi:hypothetical protein
MGGGPEPAASLNEQLRLPTSPPSLQRTQSSGTDQAALALTLLVAAWQTINQSGPWGPINIPLGLTLVLIISAYSRPTLDRKFKGIYLQVAAVAVSSSFALCLALAWPSQETIVRFASASGTNGDALGTYTTDFVFPVILALAGILLYRLILRRLRNVTANDT